MNTEDPKLEIIRAYIAHTLSETPEINIVSLSQYIHRFLVDFGLRYTLDHILYDFDEHYKVEFNIEGQRYYIEIWRTWMGGVNWVLETITNNPFERRINE